MTSSGVCGVGCHGALAARAVPAARADHDRAGPPPRVWYERSCGATTVNRVVRAFVGRRRERLVEDDRARRAVRARDAARGAPVASGASAGDVERERPVADDDAERPAARRRRAVAAGAARRRSRRRRRGRRGRRRPSPSGPMSVTVARCGVARDRDRERPELACVDDRVARRQRRRARRPRAAPRRATVTRSGPARARSGSRPRPRSRRARPPRRGAERRRRAKTRISTVRFSQPTPRSGTKIAVFTSSARPYDVDQSCETADSSV